MPTFNLVAWEMMPTKSPDPGNYPPVCYDVMLSAYICSVTIASLPLQMASTKRTRQMDRQTGPTSLGLTPELFNCFRLCCHDSRSRCL